MNRIIPLWPHEAPYTAESPGQPQPTLKEFRAENSRGAVIVCAGGGYARKTPFEGDPIAQMFCRAGFSAYVLDYRLRPCYYLAPLTDALRAIRVVRSLGYEKVAIIGFSAGGNLCSIAATLYTPGNPDAEDPIERFSSRPDAFIPCYAVISLCQFTSVGTRINMLGNLSDHLATVHHFSAELNITPDTPPAFIWHTAGDDVVRVENSLLLAGALSRNGVPFELHVFPEGPHGLGLAENNPAVHQWTDLCARWLRGLGF